jgi:hypothetical protein
MRPTMTAATSERSIEQARQKTEQVRDDLEVAGAELHLSNEMLERQLPPQHKTGDVRRAIDQTGVVADNVATAREELQEVEALLEQAIAEREQLERQLRGD